MPTDCKYLDRFHEKVYIVLEEIQKSEWDRHKQAMATRSILITIWRKIQMLEILNIFQKLDVTKKYQIHLLERKCVYFHWSIEQQFDVKTENRKANSIALQWLHKMLLRFYVKSISVKVIESIGRKLSFELDLLCSNYVEFQTQ